MQIFIKSKLFYFVLIYVSSLLIFQYGCDEITPTKPLPPRQHQNLSLPTNARINKIVFQDTLNGWLIAGLIPTKRHPGISGIFYSNNGGISWYAQYISVTKNIRTLKFIKQNILWANGDSGLMIYSRNRGKLWDQINLAESFGDSANQFYFGKIQFITDSIGWIRGGKHGLLFKSYMFQTTDGGNHWKILLKTGFPISDYYMFSEQEGLVVGTNSFDNFGDGKIYRTTDNFQTTPVQQSTPDNCGRLSKFNFVNENVGYAMGYSLLKTTNGGAVWKDVNYGYNSIIRDIATVGENHVFVAAGISLSNQPYKIFHSTNNGSSWNTELSVEFPIFRSFSFLNDSTGWIAGTFPTSIYRYRNRSWEKIF